MAQLVPPKHLLGPVHPKHQAEFKTLELLEETLGDQFKIFHGIHWATWSSDQTHLGEVDFIVLGPQGRLLLIEQKNGQLLQKAGTLFKRYDGVDKSIRMQMLRSVENLLAAFSARSSARLDLDFLLYCPDFTVLNPTISGLTPDRIVDQTSRAFLAETITSVFAERPLASQCCEDVALIESFLANELQVRYDFSHLGALARSAYIQQGAGLSQWVRSLSAPNFRLLVEATAGSGKTQLALEEIRAAANAGQTFLYVCFNTSLSADMKRATGSKHGCVTFHELTRIVYEEAGFRFEATEDGFARTEAYFDTQVEDLAGSFDLLIIDEAQDLKAAWIDALLPLCKTSGRCIVLRDSNQTLYPHEQYDFSQWHTLKHQVSYRSPRNVIDYVNEFNLSDEWISSQCALDGLEPELEFYAPDNPQSLMIATDLVVGRLLDSGIPPSEIAVLSLKGVKSSVIMQMDRIAGKSVRKASGRDTDGSTLYTDGEIYIDTVYKFKGRSANHIVLTEIDFEEIDIKARRLLFVGFTRARLQVNLVLTERAMRALEGLRQAK